VNGYPYSQVVSNVHDITAASSALANSVRVNGAAPAVTVTGVAPGGTVFGNLPLYIGRRGGASLPFSGNLYLLIVRGAASSASQIAQAETDIATKT
jgi:hypothetical protein